ncbi:hypothetical protein OIO90_002111 [Microbotryomycetes sp. JL221]|nr:hypothetical protein OIO90_002111 [Microbotryomycetes sp. JL221]
MATSASTHPWSIDQVERNIPSTGYLDGPIGQQQQQQQQKHSSDLDLTNELRPMAKKPRLNKPVPPGTVLTDKSCNPARVAELEKRLAELEAVIANRNGTATDVLQPQSSLAAPNFGALTLPSGTRVESFIATPDFRHLVDSPDSEKPNIGTGRVALAAFRAVGARTSAHSGLLGITINPQDEISHPNAPLLSAGTRRQSACAAFLRQAHAMSFENNTAEETSVESLAALLALTQMSIFVELTPKKSKTSLRAAIDQYKELVDAANNEEDRAEIKKTFGFALFSADSWIAAFGRRAPALGDGDLKTYFGNIGLVIPQLPDNRMRDVLDNLLQQARQPKQQGMLRTIRHLTHCWVCVAQRKFARVAAPPTKSSQETAAGVRTLWQAIDQIRTYIQMVLAFVSEIDTDAFSPKQNKHEHSHESDWIAQFVRLDRDLLDLQNNIHALLNRSTGNDVDLLRDESDSRVRKALKTYALYSKLYTCGADGHMIFHQFFQLELLPDWTTLALQRFGSVPGPRSPEEEVTPTELEWFIEGLQLDCFYTPEAERRLAELSPRFVQIEQQQDAFVPTFASPSASDVNLALPSGQDFNFDSLLNSFPCEDLNSTSISNQNNLALWDMASANQPEDEAVPSNCNDWSAFFSS